MANNINVRDATGNIVTVQTTETSGVHTPTQNVVGPLTDAQLRATAVATTGPLTDTQLRATPVPVSGPLTDAQLRATAVPVSISAPVNVTLTVPGPAYVPLFSGTYALAPSASLGSPIDVPVGSKTVRFFAQDCDIRYGIDGAPGTPGLNALGVGGVAKQGVWRDQLLPGGAAHVYLTSTEVSFGVTDTATALIDVEFIG